MSRLPSGGYRFNGARQAIKDINAKGIKGVKLVGVEYDDACDRNKPLRSPIVNDGIKYVIGHLFFFTQPASDNEAKAETRRAVTHRFNNMRCGLDSSRANGGKIQRR